MMTIWAVSVMFCAILFVGQYSLTIILRSRALYVGGGLHVCRATHLGHVSGEVPDRYSGRPGWGLGVGFSSSRNNPCRGEALVRKRAEVPCKKREIPRVCEIDIRTTMRHATHGQPFAYPCQYIRVLCTPRLCRVRNPGSGLCGFYVT